MTGLLVQLTGSLLAIGFIVWLVARLDLGDDPRLDGDEAARRVADETVDGFDPVAIARDAEGRAALLRDREGRVLLVRAHGNHFAGRLLEPGASAKIEDGALIVDPAERRFGTVRLMIDEVVHWKALIDRL